MNNKNYTRAFAILVSVFFFWGFVAASNDILIPVFKEKLDLTQAQSQMIAFVFYVAYTVGSLLYLGISRIMGVDPIVKYGYGKGIAAGLGLSALGTLLFIPAANSVSFPMLLGGLMVVGLGFSLQQTAANPLAIALGPANTGSQRLSLAGAINNVGTTIGPLLVSYAIFGPMTGSESDRILDVSDVKLPYLALGALFLLFAFVFWNLKVDTESAADAETSSNDKKALSYPQLWMGMIAIFVYVGVEVSTASNLPELMKQEVGLETKNIAPYISLFWASLMIGRWTSASGALGLSGFKREAMRLILPLAAFGLFLAVNSKMGHEVSSFYSYLLVVGLLVVADFISKGNPSRQLLLYSLLGIAALIYGMTASGMSSVMSFVSVGLFCSTLWPCIFTLAITGLGSQTSQGANLLVMMIMGGGFVSVAQGLLASPDSLGIKNSYWVGVICFAYLAFYAWRVGKLLRDQGLEVSAVEGGGH
jgi:FHS family L-fucose permease-like MFS transporter